MTNSVRCQLMGGVPHVLRKQRVLPWAFNPQRLPRQKEVSGRRKYENRLLRYGGGRYS